MQDLTHNSEKSIQQTTHGGYLLKVLLAEDNELTQILLVDLLKSFNIQVDTVANGRDAISSVYENKYDFVLMDCLMPIVTGLQALHSIKACSKASPPIIALTALTLRGDRDKLLNAGFDGYLAKPVKFKDLEKLCSPFLNKTPEQMTIH